MFIPKLPTPFGDPHPHVTHCLSGQAHSLSLTASRSVHSFCMGLKGYAVQNIVSGEENPQNCPFPWDFVTLPEDDRATAIGNTHKNYVKIARVLPEISSRTHTHTHTHTHTRTQTCSLQYFATAPAGEVMI